MAGLQVVAEALQVNSSLAALELPGNRISGAGAQKLQNPPKNRTQIQGNPGEYKPTENTVKKTTKNTTGWWGLEI